MSISYNTTILRENIVKLFEYDILEGMEWVIGLSVVIAILQLAVLSIIAYLLWGFIQSPGAPKIAQKENKQKALRGELSCSIH